MTDYRGNAVAGARVEARDREGQILQSSVSGDSGAFELTLPALSQRVTLRAALGFLEIREDRDISSQMAGHSIRAELKLPPETLGNKTGHVEVEVFYATDRARTGQSRPFYGDKSSAPPRLERGTIRVSIPRSHTRAQLESPSVWKLEFRENPDKHVVLLGPPVPQSADDFFRGVAAMVRKSPQKDAFVFVHGYNVTFEDAARRTAQLWYDLYFDGAPILYSWPAESRELAYFAAGDSAEWTAPHLRQFLEEVATKSGATTLHLIAHSMGNRALTRALHELASAQGPTARPRFNQVVLTAPDIDARVFRQLAESITRPAQRVTLYASSKDLAMQVARRLRGDYARAGESGDRIVVMRGIDTVDVSLVETTFMGHSYVAENLSVVTDICRLLKEGASPQSRRWLSPESHVDGPYWAFRPAQPGAAGGRSPTGSLTRQCDE